MTAPEPTTPDALLTANAVLRAQVGELSREIAQLRAALEIAQAQLYAYGYHQTHCPLYHALRGVCTCGYAAIDQTPPLVVELEEARRIASAARAYLDCACSHGVHWVDVDGEAKAEVCDLWIALGDLLRAYQAGREG